MEIATKVALFAFFGSVLLIANFWFISAASNMLRGGDLVVAPIRLIGAGAANPEREAALARMLVVRLKTITAAFAQSQGSLKANEQGGLDDGAIGFMGRARTVKLDAQLFEPTDIEVKVGGVDVAGWLPRIQRWFIRERTLSFNVSVEPDVTYITGDVAALGVADAAPIWAKIDGGSSAAIVDALAYAIIRRAWSKDESELSDLTEDEFVTLVQSVQQVAILNRRVSRYGVPIQNELAAILASVSPIAERIKNWDGLTYFAASVAEGADDKTSQLTFLTRLRDKKSKVIDAKRLKAKIEALSGGTETLAAEASQSYTDQLAATYKFYSALFPGVTVPPPPIKIISASIKNTYWDEKAINIPPGLEDIPDLLRHEAAWPFLQARWKFKYEGEVGALAMSYTDILTSYAKQAALGQSADTADWTIAPGAVSWVKGEPRTGKRDWTPLRTLKAPGTAYDDPVLGKDPQVATYARRLKGSEDNGGIHINSGIGNKAFYETAIRIGTDKAVKIWLEALPKFSPNTGYAEAAAEIRKVATRLHGAKSKEFGAVDEAWRSVGLG